jgi:hypothetical protein
MSTARTLPRFSGAADDKNVSIVAIERGADWGRPFSGADADKDVRIGASEPSSPSRRPAITHFKCRQQLPARQVNPRKGEKIKNRPPQLTKVGELAQRSGR